MSGFRGSYVRDLGWVFEIEMMEQIKAHLLKLNANEAPIILSSISQDLPSASVPPASGVRRQREADHGEPGWYCEVK